MLDEETKIAVSGCSGLLGTAFRALAGPKGWTVLPMVRNQRHSGGNTVYWNHKLGELDTQKLDGASAVVHLAGENIAGFRWTRSKKYRIEHSRVEGTAFLARMISEMDSPPPVFVCASATGFYGHRGDEILDEDKPSGSNFLAHVCRDWEEACTPLRNKGIRVVNLRFGMVLSADGSALKAMLPAFRLGLGGRLGSGDQWVSWIGIGDAARIIAFCLSGEKISGPVNAVAPNPVTNSRFTRILASVLGRPALLPAPAPLLRLLLGQMADELLLASCRAVPSRLLEHGFEFRYSELEPALRRLLG